MAHFESVQNGKPLTAHDSHTSVCVLDAVGCARHSQNLLGRARRSTGYSCGGACSTDWVRHKTKLWHQRLDDLIYPTADRRALADVEQPADSARNECDCRAAAAAMSGLTAAAEPTTVSTSIDAAA
jgi:hypothetical protein